MKNLLILLSSVITIAAVIPYVVDIIKGNTKPRVASWFIWTILTGISAAASFSDGQYSAFVLSLSATFECFTVTLLGLKYGEREFIFFDMACLSGAIVALILWYIFNSPSIAIIAAITIDLVGSLPTIKHAWEKPAEETKVTFVLSGLGAMFAFLAATSTKITAIANPLYIVAINFTIATILISRNKVIGVK